MAMSSEPEPGRREQNAGPPAEKLVQVLNAYADHKADDVLKRILSEAGLRKPPPAPSPSAPPKLKPGDKMRDGTVFAGISLDTRGPIYATPADAPLTYTFDQARKHAEKLEAFGHRDWRVPTQAELKMLFENSAAIGGFNDSETELAGYYWSSSRYPGACYAWSQRFRDGFTKDTPTNAAMSLRSVR